MMQIEHAAVNFKNKSLDQLKQLYIKSKDLYYNSPNGKTLMSDKDFDTLEDLIREQDPRWKGFGAGIKVKKFKAPLPVPIFSLDKIKTQEGLTRWFDSLESDSLVLSDKLDGAALEIVYTKGVPSKAFTRGNGKIGGDVSYILPYLRIPQKVGTTSFIIRCEGLFSKQAFQRHAHEFDAARNAASGVLNRTDIHKAVRDLTVAVIEVLQPRIQPSKGLKWAATKGFFVVPYKVVPKSKLDVDVLSKLLARRKANSKFEMDGLVLVEDRVHPVPTGNPDWGIAFKEDLATADAPVTTVEEVVWAISPKGKIVPRVRVSPVKFGGATVKYAAAFNAQFVVKHKLGPGAKIALQRSGDIIPDILQVVKSANKPQLPPSDIGEYSWDKTKVNFVLVNPTQNDTFRRKVMARFFAHIGVDFVKGGAISKLYDAGFTNIRTIVRATPKDFLKIPGVKETTANKWYEAIHKVLDQGVELPLLMDASGVFPLGMGETRFRAVAAQYDLMKLMQLDKVGMLRKLLQVPGFQAKNAEAFVIGAPKFLKWLSITQIKIGKPKTEKTKQSSSKLSGQAVTWTGYRDATQEQTVKENGGQIVPFGGKTTVLLYKASGKSSTKIQKAQDKGLVVLTWDQLVKRFKL
jgi:NAD-dependent DNA ligase